ncbi:MAG: hypothetical protein AB8I69_14665, partial [Anaerolineae bacterium]
HSAFFGRLASLTFVSQPAGGLFLYTLPYAAIGALLGAAMLATEWTVRTGFQTIQGLGHWELPAAAAPDRLYQEGKDE